MFDLGGGTFDVSILDVGDGVVEVRSTAGDTHLGGDDFDRRLVDHLADQFKNENGIDLRSDPQALQRLYEAAEKAKTELSPVTQTSVNLPFITADAAGPKHLITTLTRATFDQLTADLVERCLAPVRQALADAKITENDLDEVILVGGSTRIPAVQALVKRLTGGKEPNMSVNPDEVVALAPPCRLPHRQAAVRKRARMLVGGAAPLHLLRPKRYDHDVPRQVTGPRAHGTSNPGPEVQPAAHRGRRAAPGTQLSLRIPSNVELERAAYFYPGVLEELLPAAWHHVEQYANNPIEADHGQLKRRLRPMRGLRTRPDRAGGDRRARLRRPQDSPQRSPDPSDFRQICNAQVSSRPPNG